MTLLDLYIRRVEMDRHFFDALLSAVLADPREGASSDPLPLVSIGPSGIGGYAQREVLL